jgi:hypothetical protein
MADTGSAAPKPTTTTLGISKAGGDHANDVCCKAIDLSIIDDFIIGSSTNNDCLSNKPTLIVSHWQPKLAHQKRMTNCNSLVNASRIYPKIHNQDSEEQD